MKKQILAAAALLTAAPAFASGLTSTTASPFAAAVAGVVQAHIASIGLASTIPSALGAMPILVAADIAQAAQQTGLLP